MKKYIFIMFAAIALTACESELELTSPSELTAQGFWDTEEGASAAHAGLYADLRSNYSTLWLFGEIRSDIWGGRTFESSFNVDLIESNITAATAPFDWLSFYERIHRVNDFLKNVPDIEFSNNATKQHMLGQAYGLRAFYYYTLLKTWGGVPVITEPLADVNPSGLSKARSSQAEVMVQVKTDIEASLSAFGSQNFFGDGSIYWSKAATLALKGDVYIWSGNLMGGGSPDFNVAKTALQQIASLGMSLESSIPDLWGVENEDNSEFIFTLQYKQDEASNIYNSFTGRSTEIHEVYNDKGEFMGPSGIDFIINGANRYGPSEKTLLLTDDNDDARKEATFIRLFVDDNGGAGYDSYVESRYYGSVFNKFLGRIDGTQRIFENDVPVYRYADVLLLLAEARNLLGEDPSGEINLVRERAYGANYTPIVHAYSNSSQTDNANAILDERYKEFVGEGKRWWDLRRAGNSFVINNIEFLSAGDEYKLLLPITQNMIGRNPLLEQTPGY
ncbi:RagB/SusD family nutrient uptake outer membrane protein [Zhouia spongiae]|uniref:RagB/SusD family nutrient uptake outer membrane protein n=1 Tax=Zhouia spongiae TaxID=2202721 RepID=A0ABY3YJA9_9FLAO|nr:RagB/SusD family nutrient uptake outer membrane protein [Zhouia spongiae]UNY97735.1 RagB/SusD family nutrient uptake outer membrane protein [Zhouia spongiae]